MYAGAERALPNTVREGKASRHSVHTEERKAQLSQDPVHRRLRRRHLELEASLS